MIARFAARACAAQSGRGAQSDTTRASCAGSVGARGEPLDLPSAPLTSSFDLAHLFARLVADVQRPMAGKRRHEPQEARAEIRLKELRITAVPRGLSDSVTRNIGSKARSERSRWNIPPGFAHFATEGLLPTIRRGSTLRRTSACATRLRNDLPSWRIVSKPTVSIKGALVCKSRILVVRAQGRGKIAIRTLVNESGQPNDPASPLVCSPTVCPRGASVARFGRATHLPATRWRKPANDRTRCAVGAILQKCRAVQVLSAATNRRSGAEYIGAEAPTRILICGCCSRQRYGRVRCGAKGSGSASSIELRPVGFFESRTRP
jgi:hypothetical protein